MNTRPASRRPGLLRAAAVVGAAGLFAASVARAQVAPTAVVGASGGGAPHSIFTDPTDGAFDAGAFMLSKQGFLPVPIIITEPAVGYGAGLGLMFLRYPEGKTPAEQAAAEQAAGEDKPRIELPNITGVAGGATENGTWFVGGLHLQNFNHGATRSITGLLRAHAELTYYGAAGEGTPRDYVSDTWIFRQQIEHRLGKSDWFIGGHYTYLGADSVFDFGNSSIAGLVPNEFDSATAGLGGILSYDSRDTPFTPGAGTRAQFIASRYDEALGGDFSYTRIDAFSATWWTLDPRLVLGWRIEGHFTPGDDRVPFYHQAMVSLRGVPAGRYQGRQTLVNELELRFALNPRWSLVGFGGAGQVTMADPVEVVEADLVPAGGVGFRYLLARQLGLHTGCDFAWSEDDFAFYLTLGSAWQR
ncbi:MAG: BamA/TamA family outer membrane protein [Burkholderiales bacterium]|nr:BamA/TamA family outer membrane protein [Opitutaceae bacterium]